VLLFFLAATASACAQLLYFVEGNSYSSIAPPPKKAVIADVTATLTAQTPWGPFTYTETGKYWRSRDGKVRQDTEHGLSTVADLSSSSTRSLAYIDYDLQRIWAQMTRIPDIRAGQPREDATGKDFRSLSSAKPKKSGQDLLDGFNVTIRKGLWGGKPYEVWTADDLKMILLLKVSSEAGEFVQRYRNIRQEEPDPSIFELPPGYRMVTISTEVIRGGPVVATCPREEVGISGEPGPLEVRRHCE
jgi:hypothetical protein